MLIDRVVWNRECVIKPLLAGGRGTCELENRGRADCFIRAVAAAADAVVADAGIGRSRAGSLEVVVETFLLVAAVYSGVSDVDSDARYPYRQGRCSSQSSQKFVWLVCSVAEFELPAE